MKKETFKDKSDEDLMESYKMGEVVAFELLFERHSGKVLSYLSKRLQAPKEAQDLLQEVFFKLHRSRHQYNRTLPFSPWLFSITRSMWIDFLKKRRLEDATDPEVVDKLVQVTSGLGSSELSFGKEILDHLPSNQKEAVGLRVYDEATFEEIALKLSTSPENARQLVSRGLKRLKQIWKAREE
ncbi:MAG: RNA polymerase sigma factor [Bdellovibrionaceae bacterium]|jgi:RNA polymerase sigma factor (sigma-70 family)|nr:RNA polymerase sigma factor [Pseudobdellovibrionaceae bacterium]